MLRDRMAPEHRLQITTDGFHFYQKGVEDVFAGQADFAQMIRNIRRLRAARCGRTLFSLSDDRNDSADTRWPTRSASHKHFICRTAKPHNAAGNPPFHSPYECVLQEAGQSEAACALHFAYYNFCRIHKTLRCTPAMEAGFDRSYMDVEGTAILE